MALKNRNAVGKITWTKSVPVIDKTNKTGFSFSAFLYTGEISSIMAMSIYLKKLHLRAESMVKQNPHSKIPGNH